MDLVLGSNKDTSLFLVDASHFYGTFLVSVYIYETFSAPGCTYVYRLSYCFHSLTYISICNRADLGHAWLKVAPFSLTIPLQSCLLLLGGLSPRL